MCIRDSCRREHFICWLEHPVEQPLHVSLDRCEWRAKLVSDFVDEFNPPLLRTLERRSQRVDVACQDSEFGLSRHGDALLIVAASEIACGLADLLDGIGEPLCREDAHSDRRDHTDSESDGNCRSE